VAFGSAVTRPWSQKLRDPFSFDSTARTAFPPCYSDKFSPPPLPRPHPVFFLRWKFQSCLERPFFCASPAYSFVFFFFLNFTIVRVLHFLHRASRSYPFLSLLCLFFQLFFGPRSFLLFPPGFFCCARLV